MLKQRNICNRNSGLHDMSIRGLVFSALERSDERQVKVIYASSFDDVNSPHLKLGVTPAVLSKNRRRVRSLPNQSLPASAVVE